MADRYQRDLRGRFAKVEPERDVIAPGLGLPETFAYDLEPRHAPKGDTLAGPTEPGPLRPRTARLIDAQSGSEVHATPDRATLHADAMRDAAGSHAGELDPVRYLVGNITGITE